MKMLVTTFFGLLALTASCGAQTLFSEPFDSQASAKVIEAVQGETEISYIDYSSFTLGAANHSLSEAPNRIGGSAAAHGVIMQVNRTAGVSSIVNLLAADSPGGSAITFTGDYRLTVDMYLSLDPGADAASSGTTESGLWGIGSDAVIPLGRSNKDDASASGTWGWLANENGFGTEDAIFIIDTFPQVAKLSNGANLAIFESAFPDGSPIVSAANNTWTEVEITVINGNVSIGYNGVEFFSEASSKTDGFAMVGYEDPFSSLSFSPDYQFVIFDNLLVETASAPTIAVKQTQAFNAVNQEGSKSEGTFSVANGNATALTISEVNLSGEWGTNFVLDTPLPLVIPANQNSDLVITYTAAGARGVQTADMEIVSDDDENPSIETRLDVIFAPILLAHYKLDETSGTMVTDSSGSGADGAFEIRDPLGYAGMSLAGAGTSIGFTAAQAADSGNFAFMRPLHVPTISISMWVKPTALGGDSTLFNRDPFYNAADAIFGCFVDPSGVVNFRAGGNLVLQSEVGAVVDDESAHIVITHLDEDGFGNGTATRSRMFIDGQMVAENSDTTGFDDYPANASTQSLFIATRTAAGSGFTGLIDDIQIYSTELQAFQVDSMFHDPGSLALEGKPPAFAITGIEYDQDLARITLRWNSLPGREYKIFESVDLIVWVELEDSHLSGGLTTEYIVSDIPADAVRRYYQISE